MAVEAARAAGDLFRAEARRPGGPRGASGHAPVDRDAERLIRARLEAAFPDHGLRGEEDPAANHGPRGGDDHVWLLDPNDGTSAFQAGYRGASVSIALIRGDRPVLGVIYAYMAPDDAGDLFTWAEGEGPPQRNGRPVQVVWPTALAAEHTVLVSHHADRCPGPNATLVAPARYRGVPGIAYRLALVAAGEAVAATSLFGPRDFDYAAGHALLRGVGGALLDERGRPVRYALDAPRAVGFCFGGAPALLPELAARDWDGLLRAPPAEREPYELVRPSAQALHPDAGVLARAQGAWLGQLAGDALGSQVEFQGPARIAQAWPEGVRRMAGGGPFDTIAGQPTDDSEMALVLARTLVTDGGWAAEAAARAYVHWLRSDPFDIGGTISQALRGAAAASGGGTAEAARRSANPESQANGALMRISPLALFGWDAPAEALVEWARADAALTHPHPVCQDANAVFVVALAHAVATGADGRAVHARAVQFATSAGLHPDVQETLAEAALRRPADYTRQAGWVRLALQNAFWQVLHAPSFEEGLVDTVGRGGDTDTNAAIAGALLGAVHGREAIPPAWRDRVLTCRPIHGLPGVRRPRPRAFWPVDALVLAERLLFARR